MGAKARDPRTASVPPPVRVPPLQVWVEACAPPLRLSTRGLDSVPDVCVKALVFRAPAPVPDRESDPPSRFRAPTVGVRVPTFSVVVPSLTCSIPSTLKPAGCAVIARSAPHERSVPVLATFKPPETVALMVPAEEPRYSSKMASGPICSVPAEESSVTRAELAVCWVSKNATPAPGVPGLASTSSRPAFSRLSVPVPAALNPAFPKPEGIAKRRVPPAAVVMVFTPLSACASDMTVASARDPMFKCWSARAG